MIPIYDLDCIPSSLIMMIKNQEAIYEGFHKGE